MHISLETLQWIQVIINLVLLLFLFRLFIKILPVAFLTRQKLPFVPTSKRIIKKIYQAGVFNGVTSGVDLGSGDGSLLQHVSWYMPAMQLTGVELKPFLHKLAMWRFRVNLLQKIVKRSKKPTLVLGDMFAQDISTTDMVIGFWIPDMTPLVAAKCIEEGKVGLKVVSYMFPLTFPEVPGFRMTSQVIHVPRSVALFSSKSDRVFVYEKVAS